MAVKQVGEIYLCKVCGNEVKVTKVGGGTLVCCGQDMVQPAEGTVEDSQTRTTHLG